MSFTLARFRPFDPNWRTCTFDPNWRTCTFSGVAKVQLRQLDAASPSELAQIHVQGCGKVRLRQVARGLAA